MSFLNISLEFMDLNILDMSFQHSAFIILKIIKGAQKYPILGQSGTRYNSSVSSSDLGL